MPASPYSLKRRDPEALDEIAKHWLLGMVWGIGVGKKGVGSLMVIKRRNRRTILLRRPKCELEVETAPRPGKTLGNWWNDCGLAPFVWLSLPLGSS